MSEDYRRTKYDLPNEELKEKKKAVESLIKRDHPKAKDMHAYIKKKEGPYRLEFIKAYKGRCAYCGVSYKVISTELFEIDHFKYEKGFSRKADAGYMDNLVLACHSCNHAKGELVISKDIESALHPDNTKITNVFWRDDLYYIRIQKDYLHHLGIQEFYTKLELGGEIHRLDYLLMSMNGLCEKIGSEHKAAANLDKAIKLLNARRNIGVFKI